MDERRELRKMSGGERCPECGSRRWYLQDGLRYCSRGHQIEGFIEFDVGEEQESGRLGAVSRKAKEKKQSEKRRLSGRDGKLLYLEALQLLLRRQVLWLVQEQNLGEELETVVRDLWDLRTRGFPDNRPAANEEELPMFSSQPSSAQERTPWKPQARAQSWNPDRDTDWPMPKLPDTLSLCYLASILLRIPMRQAQILDWANSGQMPYRNAFELLPHEMRDRMPSGFTQALKMPLQCSLSGKQLGKATMDLVLSYHLNYDMTFPEISYMAMLVHYAKMLSLPVESVIVTQALATILKHEFRYPTGKPKARRRSMGTRGIKIFPLDHPETRLVALLVVATKLCFPFEGKVSSLRCAGDVQLSYFDWDAWKQGMLPRVGADARKENSTDFADVTPSQVAHMSDEAFREYCAHILTHGGGAEDGNQFLARFFATPDSLLDSLPDALPDSLQQGPIARATNQEEAHERARELLSQTLRSPRDREASASNSGNTYEAFRTPEDLSGTAKAFYQVAGDAAGISLNVLVGAVYKQEQAIVSWQKPRKTKQGQNDRARTRQNNPR